MMRLNKIASLLSFTVVNFAQAGATLELSPASPARQLNVSKAATAPFVSVWLVRNNSSKTISPRFSVSSNAEAGSGTPLPGNAVSMSGACVQIAPQGTCTVRFEISGSQLQSGTSYEFSPVACIGGGQMCNRPISSNRLTINTTSNPNPSGNWVSLGTVERNIVPQYLTINYPKYALGVINQDFSPTVVECPDIDSVYGCMLLGNGLLDQNFNTMTGLDYDSNGNLIGLFLKFPLDAQTPNTSYIMQYPASSNAWTSFANSFSGSAQGLDTSSSLGILVGSSLDSSGVAKQFTSNSALSQSNSLSKSLTEIVDDGLGNIYVAGQGLTPQTAGLWLWDSSKQSFTAINLGSNVLTLVTDMVSDGQGTIYLSGLDEHSEGQVWKYSSVSQLFESTGISASYVSTLEWSPFGYLLAGVVDDVNYNGDVYFYANNVWTSLGLTGCEDVDAIAADGNNDILVAGLTSMGESGIWRYN